MTNKNEDALPIYSDLSKDKSLGFGSMARILRKNVRTIIATSVVINVIAFTYIFFIHAEKYNSEAILFLKGKGSPTIISQFAAEAGFNDISPFKNQEALLRSERLLVKVYDQ